MVGYAYPAIDILQDEYTTLVPLLPEHGHELWRAAREGGPELFHHLFFGPFEHRADLQAWIEERSGQRENPVFAIRSERLSAEGIGFTLEGVFRKHMFIRGRSRDTAWYAVVDSDWERVRAILNSRIDERAHRSEIR